MPNIGLNGAGAGADTSPPRRRRSPRARTGLPARCIALILLGPAGACAAERIYAWRDPVTGSLQLAGAPPAWYAAGAPGPRTRVLEKGRIVDDTAWDEAHRAFPTAPATGPEMNIPADAGAARDPQLRLQEFKALLDAWDAAQQGPAPQAPPAVRVP